MVTYLTAWVGATFSARGRRRPRLLDDVIGADEASTAKPNPAVYENAADRTGTPIGNCRLVSGNVRDVAGAGSAGMATARVDRANEPFERIAVEPSLEVTGFAVVADELA